MRRDAHIVSGLPLHEADVRALAGADHLVEHVVLTRRDGRAAEPFGELQVLAILAGLPAADRQFGIAGADAREAFGHPLAKGRASWRCTPGLAPTRVET